MNQRLDSHEQETTFWPSGGASPGARSPTEAIAGGNPGHIPQPNAHYPNVPGFRIKRLIKVGGMGAVYHAVKLAPSGITWFERDVALKVLRAADFSPRAIEDFKRECNIIAKVDRHPAIAKIFEADEYEERGQRHPYYAMEYIPGERTLNAYAKDRSPSLRESVLIIAEVASALATAHATGVVHLDIKPQNIMVDPEGRPFLIDFGIARAADFGNPRDGQRVAGTPEYMSPEQTDLPAAALEGTSDIYSLGVVAFELICGKKPYEINRFEPGWRVTIKSTAAPPLHEIDPRVDPELDAIVHKALEKRPDQRWASAKEFERALRGWIDLQNVSKGAEAARRQGPVAQARAWIASRLGTTLALVMAASLLLSELVVLSLVYLTPIHERWLGLLSELAPKTPPDALKGMALVTITDQDAMPAIAASAGVPGVGTEPPSWRALHGALIDRLAPVKPLVIAFDIVMRKPQPGDARLADAVQRAAAAGVPSVFVCGSWEAASSTPVEFSAELSARGVIGAPATITPSTGQVGTIELAMRHPGQRVIPSFSLLTFTLGRRQGAPSFSFDHEEVAVSCTFESGPLLLNLPVAEFDVCDEPDAEFGIQIGSEVAVYNVIVPEDPLYWARTIPYADVFSMDEETLAATFGGKTVMVFDAREGIDLFEMQPRGMIPKAYLHVAAVSALERSSVIRSYVPAVHRWSAVGAALVGTMLGAMYWRWPRRMLIGLGVWFALSVCIYAASIVIFLLTRIVLDPTVLMLCMLVSGGAAVLVRNFARASVSGTNLRATLS